MGPELQKAERVAREWLAPTAWEPLHLTVFPGSAVGSDAVPRALIVTKREDAATSARSPRGELFLAMAIAFETPCEVAEIVADAPASYALSPYFTEMELAGVLVAGRPLAELFTTG